MAPPAFATVHNILKPLIMPQKRNHTELICNVGELSGLFSDATSLETFLQRTVEMIVEHMQADVCSIYLFYDDVQELVLKATKGLKSEAVGRVKLKLGEGLTGRAVKELRPICERHASQHPDYKYFSDIGEEPYESFLAVPILRGQARIGAMVLQNAQKNYFDSDDIRTFQAITSQLATTLETARLLMSLKEEREQGEIPDKGQDVKFIKAQVGAEGFAYAEVEVFDREALLPFAGVTGQDTAHTRADFDRALALTKQQLEQMQQDIEARLSDMASLIFTAQLLMLKDQEFIDDIVQQIDGGSAPEAAIIQTVKRFVALFDALPNTYLREKRYDVRDIGIRLLENLQGTEAFSQHHTGKIIIAQQVLPSDILKFYSLKIKGLVLLSGGVTSHIAILARSLELPLLICEEPVLLTLPQDTRMFLDGEQGNIYVNPEEEILARFREREQALLCQQHVGDRICAETRTSDGARVSLLANINLLSDIRVALSCKAEGIGLYRTEFPFIIRSDFPSEEEQYVIYRKVVEGMPGRAVTFRTLDIGGDKVLSYYNYGKEENPFLGMRSIRFSLRHKDIFHSQLRAILRAGHGAADVKIMFPMISSVDEFLEAKQEVDLCLEGLRKEGMPCHSSPAVGMMVELPAVLEIITALADVADFFSIGTNDFVQYMLAVDRTNEKVADLYLSHHPAVLKAIHRIVSAAMDKGRDISICGLMAQDVRFLPFFVGIGVRQLSLDPHAFYNVQSALARLSVRYAEQVAQDLLRQHSLEAVAQRLVP